jgi:hypothetical protein
MYCTTLYHDLTTTTPAPESTHRSNRSSKTAISRPKLALSDPTRISLGGRKVLLISRFQVRVLGGSLGKSLVLQVKRCGAKKPLVEYQGLFTATGLLLTSGQANSEQDAREHHPGGSHRDAGKRSSAYPWRICDLRSAVLRSWKRKRRPRPACIRTGLLPSRRPRRRPCRAGRGSRCQGLA